MAKVRNSFFYRLRMGLYILYRTYVAALDRSKFGFIADDVTLIPPLSLSNPRNIFLYGDNGLKDAKIFTNNARFIMKPHSGAAEGLRVSTGNHAMVLGRFYRTIKEKDKPKEQDKDVLVESDVWIGRNVTLLAGVTIGRGVYHRSRCRRNKGYASLHCLRWRTCKAYQIQVDYAGNLEARGKAIPREREIYHV